VSTCDKNEAMVRYSLSHSIFLTNVVSYFVAQDTTPDHSMVAPII
jgi:hypothetical protein